MSTADPDGSHAQRVAQAVRMLREAPAAPLALAKNTSNLFRDRSDAPRSRLDLRGFRHILELNEEEGWVDVEGMATYEALVEWCLPRGVMPAVVPQLKTITVGGAVAGVGIEATSFRHGLVHQTMGELEVLLPAGDVAVCKPLGEHRDLFYGFPNSYGCLGYALRVRLETVPVRPFVHVRHWKFAQAESFFAALAEACGEDNDFVDGVVFGPAEFVLSTARFVMQAPACSDYTLEHIYWHSLRERDEDYLTTGGYLWRWDTDWFWCSSRFGANHAWVRRLLGRQRLNSRTYGKWMRWNSRWQVTQALARWRGLYRESVIQDVDLPIERAPCFLDFLEREIGIHPIWICPVQGDRIGERFPLYPLDSSRLYVNFGFWDVLQTRQPHEPAHFNRLVERELLRVGGIKSLYSDSYFTQDDFWRMYDRAAYQALRKRYDPQGRAPDLYDKCVRNA